MNTSFVDIVRTSKAELAEGVRLSVKQYLQRDVLVTYVGIREKSDQYVKSLPQDT